MPTTRTKRDDIHVNDSARSAAPALVATAPLLPSHTAFAASNSAPAKKLHVSFFALNTRSGSCHDSSTGCCTQTGGGTGGGVNGSVGGWVGTETDRQERAIGSALGCVREFPPLTYRDQVALLIL